MMNLSMMITMMMTLRVMMIIGGIVVIVAQSGCLIPSANYGGDKMAQRHFTPQKHDDENENSGMMIVLPLGLLNAKNS